jgi:hypothetical protein
VVYIISISEKYDPVFRNVRFLHTSVKWVKISSVIHIETSILYGLTTIYFLFVVFSVNFIVFRNKINKYHFYLITSVIKNVLLKPTSYFGLTGHQYVVC